MMTISFISALLQNVHYRTPTTHIMPDWARNIFIEKLPKYLLMRRPPPMKVEGLSRNAQKAVCFYFMKLKKFNIIK